MLQHHSSRNYTFARPRRPTNKRCALKRLSGVLRKLHRHGALPGHKLFLPSRGHCQPQRAAALRTRTPPSPPSLLLTDQHEYRIRLHQKLVLCINSNSRTTTIRCTLSLRSGWSSGLGSNALYIVTPDLISVVIFCIDIVGYNLVWDYIFFPALYNS